MAIRARLLNSLVHIKRFSGDNVSLSGEIGSGHDTVAANVPCRICSNKQFGDVNANVHTYIASSSHIIFTQIGVNVKTGDVADNFEDGEQYVVTYVDKKPGGKKDSHYQIYVRMSEYYELS